MKTNAERNAQLKRLQDRSREQKRRIAAGEVLVCDAGNVQSGEKSPDGRPIYHKDARPGPDYDILAMSALWVCPHCKTNITIHRKFWDHQKQDWVRADAR